MDAHNVFRQVEGFGTYPLRPPHVFHPPQRPAKVEAQGENDGSHRIAHTLTACCRCRQRKTRCDPTLPRCLPCERSGSVCEYFDTTKGKKISRYYVVELQDRVRALEAELGQYTDEDDLPKDNEDFIRPGGLVRLNETDETPRYLGPSSGIAMTRLLMEEAKRYTESARISELIPEVRVRRRSPTPGLPAAASTGTRSRSFSVLPAAASRRKSYPMISAVPAQNLPSRAIADKLVEVFVQRGQVFTPILHERLLGASVDEVYAGNQEAYQNFLVRLVMATSLQKLDATYAGLADSYYLAAMQYFEDVLRPKDLRTLQCLVLLAQYSLLTPTRTAVYYIVGLATRICQQLGLADEKTIAIGVADPLTIDVRRRVSWSVTVMEFGLSQCMGRPTGFAKTNDRIDVKFFDTVSDANISENGIVPGPPDEKKLVAIHFCKMRELQAEIRRVLYEKKRTEPEDDRHPWFAAMENKVRLWLDASPESPPWCKPWYETPPFKVAEVSRGITRRIYRFTGKFHATIVTLYRPSPQVPRPSAQSATKCFDSSAYVINVSKQQMVAAAVDITWVFLLTLYMAINALLWSVTYPEIRALHPREEVQELVDVSLDIIDQCSERWPGTSAASQLYSTFAKACLQSYESRDTPALSNSSSYDTPPSQPDTHLNPFEASHHAAASKQNASVFSPPQFGSVFDSAPEPVTEFGFDNPFPSQPTFRSNSIFHNPTSSDPMGRRFSYFPPDFTQPQELSLVEGPSPPASEAAMSPPIHSPPQHDTPQQDTPTPPARMPPGAEAPPAMNPPLVSTPLIPAQNPNRTSPDVPVNPMPHHAPHQQQQPRPPPPAFTIPPVPPQHHPHGQRPLPPPNTIADWFNPPPPFISPYTFGAAGGGLWGSGPAADGHGTAGPNFSQFSGLPLERDRSLSQEQQAELYDVLENEGMTDIDTYLSTAMDYTYTKGNAAAANPNSQVHWTGCP
ncbi:hypothetical protein DL771_006693 [Monosporascus sp. 5C6A]|nr:hypothetical protein DL771_006693 [Monosporascus sp. 5C6A]